MRTSVSPEVDQSLSPPTAMSSVALTLKLILVLFCCSYAGQISGVVELVSGAPLGSRSLAKLIQYWWRRRP